MKSFKVVVLKWAQRFTLIRKAINEFQLKEDLHKEGFSVWSIEEIKDWEITGNKYYFDVLEKWELKTWTISSNDIFKSYLKIKYEMKYNLQYIYYEPTTSLEEKQKILHELEEQYEIYIQTNKKVLQKEEEQQQKKVEQNVIQEESIDSFQMKKEIEMVSKVIERVLIKLKFFIDIPDENIISFEKKQKLKTVFDEITKLKTSTNVYKLKQIWEIGLVKIWEIELEILEQKKSQEMKKLLWETNKMLKFVWSKESFIEKEKDIWYILQKTSQWILDLFLSKKKKTTQEIDTKSSSYLKTKALYLKYQNKYRQNQIEILKKFYIFLIPTKEFQKQSEYLLLKQKVIQQNMMILKTKLTTTHFSYTKIVKWYNFFVEKILQLLYFLKDPLFFFILMYGVIFILFQNIKYYNILNIDLNLSGLFYFILILLFYICVHFSRWIVSLIFNFVFFWFIFIVWVINF